MPRFYFHLRANGTIHRDLDGVECADVVAARSHAAAVAAELMRQAGRSTWHWSMRVEGRRGWSFDLFFADVEPGSLRPEVRAVVARTCRRHGALVDVICAVQATWAESGVLLARARGRPCLVHANGRRR